MNHTALYHNVHSAGFLADGHTYLWAEVSVQNMEDAS